MRFLAGVERTLTRADHALLLQVRAPGEDDPAVAAYARLAAGARVDGFVLTDVELGDPRFALLEELGVPAVVAGRPVDPCPFPSLETDHAAGVAAAVAHLVALGHRRVGFVGGDERLEHVRERRRAWAQALRAADLEPGPVAFAGPRDPHAADATGALLAAASRPTALVFTSDALAMAGLAVARAAGLEVPGDLSVTGFDDAPMAALASPPLTSVRVDYGGFGAAAAALLLAGLDGAPAPAWELAPAAVVVRGSTAPPGPR